MIKLKGISQHFREVGSHDIHALHGVDLTIDREEIFGIIGRNGAGKNTLVRVINLLGRPTSGTVTVTGWEFITLNTNGLRQIRRKIGMIFQHFNLLSLHTVYDNVALPLELAGTSRERIHRIVLPLLELVGLSAYKDRYPAQISGDQKQHIGIARALTSQPNVLLSDKAASTLDSEATRSILDLLRKVNDELSLTIVLIAHQMEVIEQVYDRTAVLDAGHIVELGHVVGVFPRPEHDVTRVLIGEMISQGLPPSVLTRVESRPTAREQGGRDHLPRLASTGTGVDQPVLAQTVRDCGLDLSILHGHIDEIQGQVFGSLTILALDGTTDINNAMDFLHEQGTVVEKINHMI